MVITYRNGAQKDIPAIAQLLVDTWQRCYTGFVPQEFLDNLDTVRQVRRHTAYLEDGTTYYVAENGLNEVVGFISFGKNRMAEYKAATELYAFYVTPGLHGQGIGGALLQCLLKDVEGRGGGLLVSVFEKNPFKSFYLKHGFVKIGEEMLDIGGVELVSAVYFRANSD